MSSKAHPGATLRVLRKRNHWTLADVSERTGIPRSTLSRIENNRTSPSYEHLVQLSQGLQIDMAQLFSTLSGAAPVAQNGRRSITRNGDGRTIDSKKESLTYLHTDLLSKAFSSMIAEVNCRRIEDYGGFQHHAGEELLYVIEGELELHTQQYAPVTLGKGDSIHFDSSMPHAYVARGAKRCRVLSICTAEHAHVVDSSARPGLVKPAARAQESPRRTARRRSGQSRS